MQHSTSTEHNVSCVTLTDLIEKLTTYDEVMILEMLNINTEMLIKAFMDEIEDKADELIREVF